jgi:uncharacterized coiled-coil protein SlyX
MAAGETIERKRVSTPEEVWALFAESERRMQADYERRKEEDERRWAKYERERAEYAREQAEYKRRQEEAWRKSEEEYLKLKASIEATDRQIAETGRRIAETGRQIEATDRQIAETDRQMKETDKKMGALSNRFGELAEHLVIPNIAAKFNPLGFSFSEAGRKTISDRENGIFLEIDILLENGDKAMAVEVKSRLLNKDTDEHIHRLNKLRTYANKKGDRRKFYGAVAGAIMSDSARNYALKKGLYVIEQSGDTVFISSPEKFCPPRAW